MPNTQLSLITQIEELLQKDLPGWPAQRLLSPIKTSEYQSQTDNTQQAGVNLILYPNAQEQLEILFIKRQNNIPGDKHGGQIGFPGGKREINDSNLIETAFRETEEEIGIPADKLHLLGSLSPLFVYVSNFLVQPIVSYLDHTPNLTLQKSEVDLVIGQKLDYFISDNAVKHQDFKVRDFMMKDMPHYKLQNHILWGATAMITSEFVQIIKGLR